MERIFASFKDSGGSNTSAYDPDDPDSYEQYLHAMITDARDYEGSVLASGRDYAQKVLLRPVAYALTGREPLFRHDLRRGRQCDLRRVQQG